MQAFRALFVSGIALIIDMLILWSLSLTGLHYMICAFWGFIGGTLMNFLLSIKFVFTKKARLGRTGEVTVHFIVSFVGLGLTELLMWLFTEIFGLYFMISKCFAAVIVFGWNFTARKLILYR